jgi:phosphoribosyl-ATP pyrophosphohydrolase/phosphoribosyl-AMP cyclohydrolase
MVGFMNEEAYRKTILTGYVTFWSRSRSVIWTKGETSGNTLEVVEVFTDCDDDALLITARMKGRGVCCHTRNKICFYKKVMNNDLTEV